MLTRSVVLFSNALAVTAVSVPAFTVRQRNSSFTHLTTTSATVRLRKLWITRINVAVRAEGITYNRFIQGLRLAGIELDRRALAELAVSDAETFKAIVEQAKAALPADVNAPVEA